MWKWLIETFLLAFGSYLKTWLDAQNAQRAAVSENAAAISAAVADERSKIDVPITAGDLVNRLRDDAKSADA